MPTNLHQDAQVILHKDSMGDAPTTPVTAASTRKPQILPVDNATTPYWRTDLHAIDSHRSTEELPSGCDIVIIGAGMAGVCTAYHIVKQVRESSGVDMPSIVLLDARRVCEGATGRNGVCLSSSIESELVH